ncbi:MAG: CDP-alcohol phosphatidyltransferase family protein [Planctomycetia bacterium]|nr:CDP-alcohol phosphatidyltransferase family protein [Planctomycetia bacterium]
MDVEKVSWPNRITILRILLATPFAILLLNARDAPAYRYMALGVIAIMAICDWIDGVLARRLGAISTLGTILDPIADMSVLITALIILALPGRLEFHGAGGAVVHFHFPYWVTVTLIARYLFIVFALVVLYLLTGFKQPTPSGTGKAATAVLYVMVVLTLLAPDMAVVSLLGTRILLYILWGAAVLLGVISWLGYLYTGSRILHAGNTDQH